MLTVSVLGPVDAARDGVRLDVPAGKTSELLARLALQPGAHVRADVLIEDLWSGRASRNTLQSKVSQLRKALGDGALVIGDRDGYVLAVDPAGVDAHRVVGLAAQAEQARADGDPAATLARAREALALFRGEILVEAGDWAVPQRARLEEIRLGLVEGVMAARVELGSGSDVVSDLESLVEQHPLREALWSSLITALYRAGRQADALAACSRIRRALRDELGIDPGPGLRSLEQLVLRQSPSLGAVVTPRPGGVPGNLPPPGAPLVGRDEDRAELAERLREHRLVTLVGPAGVGKTRLAVETARVLTPPGGVWLVRLDAVEAPAQVRQIVAETLHVPATGLADRLTGAETVLVLDNCEHVAAPVAELVRWLLAAAPGSRVLATSQVPLGLEDEHVRPIAPLAQPRAVELFVRQARAMRERLVLDAGSLAAVEEVCRALDGLPLAIELAASRMRSLSVQDIARRLDDPLVLLRDPTSHRPERHRALAGALAWSYGLLFPDDRRGLWALSCFAGDASLDAVEHVLVALGVPRGSVLDTIGRLVDRSLVAVEDAGSGAVRYRLLKPVQAFSSERLHESGEAAQAAAAHAAWYAANARWCQENVRGSHQPECLAFARSERANVDAALAWCAAHDPALGLRIVNGLGWTWVVLGDGPAGAARVRGALTDDAPARERAGAWLLAGWLEASAGNVALAEADLDTADQLASGDPLLTADVARHRAFLALQQGRPEAVLAHAAAGLAVYRAHGEAWSSAGALLLAAYGALMLGDLAAASRDATETLRLVAPLGDAWAMVHAEAMLGAIAQAQHRYDAAARALSRAADDSARLGFPGQAALHRATLGRVQQRLGDAAAPHSLERAIGEALAVGDGRLAATARLHLARSLRVAGERARTLDLLEENDRWYRAAGGGDHALLSGCLLAAERDDDAGLRAALDEARGAGAVDVQVLALDALARLAAGRDPVRARALLAEADALAVRAGHVLDDADRFDAGRARAIEAGGDGLRPSSGRLPNQA